jgi:hypothetical protein
MQAHARARSSLMAVLAVVEEVVEDLVVQALELDLLRVPAGPPPRRGAGGGGRRRRRRPAAPPARRPARDDLAGEVEHGGGAALGERRPVVRPRGLLGRVERAEPHPGPAALRVADLGCELAPGALPHAAVLGAAGVLAAVVLHGCVLEPRVAASDRAARRCS